MHDRATIEQSLQQIANLPLNKVRGFFLDIWLELIYTFNNKDGTMKTLMKFLENVYIYFYLAIGAIVGLILTVILFPFAFFSNKNHHEESGYDL